MRHPSRTLALLALLSAPLVQAQSPRFATQADLVTGAYPGGGEAITWGGVGQLALTYPSGLTLGVLGYAAEQIRLDDNGAYSYAVGLQAGREVRLWQTTGEALTLSAHAGAGPSVVWGRGFYESPTRSNASFVAPGLIGQAGLALDLYQTVQLRAGLLGDLNTEISSTGLSLGVGLSLPSGR